MSVILLVVIVDKLKSGNGKLSLEVLFLARVGMRRSGKLSIDFNNCFEMVQGLTKVVDISLDFSCFETFNFSFSMTKEPSMPDPFGFLMELKPLGADHVRHNQYQVIQVIQPVAGIKPRTVHLYCTS